VFTSFGSPSLDFGRSGINVGANRVSAFDPRLEVAAAETRIEVNGESSEMLVRDSPLRGGNFKPREVRDLPWIESVLPGSDTTRRRGRRGQLGHERPGKHGRPILDYWPAPARRMLANRGRNK
jgi:hypothetical protein